MWIRSVRTVSRVPIYPYRVPVYMYMLQFSVRVNLFNINFAQMDVTFTEKRITTLINTVLLSTIQEVTIDTETQFDKSCAANCFFFKQFSLHLNLLYNFTIITDLVQNLTLNYFRRFHPKIVSALLYYIVGFYWYNICHVITFNSGNRTIFAYDKSNNNNKQSI